MKEKKKQRSAIKRVIAFGFASLFVVSALPSAAVADNKSAEDKEQILAQSFNVPAMSEEVLFTSMPVMSKMISKDKFVTTNHIDTENQAFIMNMTTGELLADANQNQHMNAYDILKPLVTKVFLMKDNLDDIVTVKASSLKKVDEDADVFGLSAGDQISVRDLLSVYLLTDAADTYRVLVDYISTSDFNFVTLLNKTCQKLSLEKTSFSNVYASYQEGQYSSMYDAYQLYYSLMQDEWFMDIVKTRSMTISYKNYKNKSVKQTVDNLNSSWCTSVGVGSDYKYYGQISMRGDNDKDGQFVIFMDKLDQYYLSYLGNVNSLRSISSESGRLIRTLSGYDFTDAEIIATPSPTPTPRPTATPTPKPTATPTPTPKPTATPIPTPTPKPAVGKSGLPISSNNARYQYIFGSNYKAYTMTDRPTGYKSATEAAKNMSTFTVPVWKMNSNGTKYASKMTITIHKKLADSVKKIYNEIYALDCKFPIKYMVGYSYRKVGGVGLMNSTLMSAHSFGCAIDINPGDYDNDYFLGKGNDLRNKKNPYCIPDEVIAIFEKYGWNWGGNFEICSDTMHFQYLGLEFLTYQGKNNFRELKYDSGKVMSGADVRNLQQRLTKLGYTVSATGQYGQATVTAIKNFQKAYKLPVTGVVNYKTWETLINATHDMSYVF